MPASYRDDAMLATDPNNLEIRLLMEQRRQGFVIPFVPGDEQQLGPKVNDAYFGKVPTDRLVVRDDVLFFRGDGQYRSKIGINPARARELLGSYAASGNLLTIVSYSKPAGATKYVNSMWEDIVA